MYIKKGDNTAQIAGLIVAERVHGAYDEDDRVLTVDEIVQVAKLLLLWARFQRGGVSDEVD